MTRFLPALIATALLGIAATAAPAAAQNVDLSINNRSNHTVWVSVYDSKKQRWDQGCVDPGKTYPLGWTPGSWSGTGGGIYVRQERKSGPACTGNTTLDTSFGNLLTPINNRINVDMY